jgi:hypothetical protein
MTMELSQLLLDQWNALLMGGLDIRWVVSIGNPLVPLFQRLGNLPGKYSVVQLA